MQVEVYPTDADALDATAALVAERARAAEGRARVALGGGRAGRAVMVALAGCGELPWARVDWFLADERCGPRDDPYGHAKVARDSLFGPRGVAASAVCGPVPDGPPEGVAAGYAATLAARLGPGGRVDVVVLGLDGDGALGALAPGCDALDADAWVAPVPPAAAGEPARVSVTPALLARAGHVLVVALGPGAAGPFARALRDGEGPAARVPPSARVTWIADRAAAAELLKDATPAAP